MKKFLLKIVIFVFVLFNSITVFATDPSNQGEGETVEDPETPINTRLLWLLVAGIAFAFYYFYNQRKKQVTK